MADNSKIEWTDASWNPIRARDGAMGKVGWHCTHVSEGCRNCYAEDINRRLGTGHDYKPVTLSSGQVEVFLDETMLLQPLRWKKPRKIFVGSMTDLFADFVTDAMLDRIWAVMALAPQHTFQIVTKRPARMRAYLTGDGLTGGRALQVAVELLGPLVESGDIAADQKLFDLQNRVLGSLPPIIDRWPLSNVWLMVSAEDQATADERIPDLLATPAAVRGISAEPLLNGINFNSTLGGTLWMGGQRGCDGMHHGNGSPECPRELHHHHDERCRKGLDLVIVGGESGRNARPMHPDWARNIRDQCEAAGVAFFFKQWGGWTPGENLGPAKRAQRGATHVKGEWMFEDFSLSALEGLHIEDEPTVWRAGKKAAGRLLDGREHNDLPERAS